MKLKKYIDDNFEGNQSQFAKHSGMSLTTINRIVNHGACLTRTNANKLYKATGGEVTAVDAYRHYLGL